MANKGSCSRAAGQKKRNSLSKEQVQNLEMMYKSYYNPTREMKKKIAMELGLTIKQVFNWFQNQRTKENKKDMELELADLKAKNQHIMEKYYHLSLAKDVEIANANAQIHLLKSKLMDRESAAAPWNPMGYWSSMDDVSLGFTAGTSLAAPAAVDQAPVYPHFFEGGATNELANIFNNDYGVGGFHDQPYFL